MPTLKTHADFWKKVEKADMDSWGNLKNLAAGNDVAAVREWLAEQGSPGGETGKPVEGSQARAAAAALIVAANYGYVEMVEILLAVGNPLAEDSLALRLAAKYGHKKVVRMLILVSDPKASASEALRFAAENGHAEVVEMLLPVSDPKAAESYALRMAARRGCADIVALLIPVSDPKALCSYALECAAERGHKEIVEMLLPVSDVFAKIKDAPSAAEQARQEGFDEVADLIEAYALALKEKRALARTGAAGKPALKKRL